MAKKKLIIAQEVTDCRDCPFAKSHYGHGECWTYCSHPENGREAFENILWGCQENFKKTPDWCPLNDNTIVWK